MWFRGQYGLLVLAIVPTSVWAKNKLEPVQVAGNPGSYFGAEAYPLEAIRAKEQGRVVATVDVDAGGKAIHCKTSISSGSTSLDARTCAITLADVHFIPARDSHGHVTAGSYRLAVRWVLPANSSDVALDANARLVTFSGTASAPVCSTPVDNIVRHLTPARCRALVSIVLSHGADLTQPGYINVPDRPDYLLPLSDSAAGRVASDALHRPH